MIRTQTAAPSGGGWRGRRPLAASVPPAAWDAAGATLLAVIAALLVAASAALGAQYPWKALAAAVACLAVGVVAGRGLVPRVLGAADRVTLARAALVMLVIAMHGEAPGAAASAAVVIATLAALMDAADGWVARRTGRASTFGARFDMETDALLILALSLLAWHWDRAGAWILVAGLARYAFVAAGAWLPWLRRALPRSRRRQAACVAQVVTLIACIAPWVPAPVGHAVAAAGLAVLLLSFAVDVWWLWARACGEEGGRP